MDPDDLNLLVIFRNENAAAPEKLECRTSIDSDVQLRLPHSIMVGEQAGWLVTSESKKGLINKTTMDRLYTGSDWDDCTLLYGT